MQVQYTQAIGQLARASAAEAGAKAGLTGPDGAPAFMGAADHARLMLQANPHLLTPEGRLASANGAAPMFEVAQRLMDDARTSSRFAGTQSLPALPTPASQSATAPSTSATTRAALAAATEAAEAAKLAAGGRRQQLAPATAHSIQVEEEGDGIGGEAAAAAAPAPKPQLPDTPENRAAVMAKLQSLQKQWAAAKWQPGQPLPAGVPHPTFVFQGEMHLLPPALAKFLQSMGGTQ